MKILLSHLTGNANVKSAAYGFFEANILAEFHVAIASIPGSVLDRIGSINLFSEIRRRRFNPVLKPFMHTWPWFELARMVSLKTGFASLTNKRTAPFFIDAVVQNLDKHVANSLRNAKKKGANAVYCYEDVAIFSFREAKRLGLQCFYDLPIGYWRTAHRLLEAERERWPAWIPTMTGLSDWNEKLARKDEELKMADRIFVASTFTEKTLKDFPGSLAPIEVVPYGFPPVNDVPRLYPGFKNGRPLKLLFVGSLSQRKGIADLFAAVKVLGEKVTLTLVGSKTIHGCAVLENALARHTYISSLPHHEILKLMREHDVLVFPSLFEGFGLVITEAMSQGTPVITTDRTAGPDIIKHNNNGWLIEAGSTIALKEAIENLLMNPASIEGTSRAAMETARLRPWELYGKELSEACGKN